MYAIVEIPAGTLIAKVVDSNHYNLDYARRALDRFRSSVLPGGPTYMMGEVVEVTGTDPIDPIGIANVCRSNGGIVLNMVPRSPSGLPAKIRVFVIGHDPVFEETLKQTRPDAVMSRVEAPIHLRSR